MNFQSPYASRKKQVYALYKTFKLATEIDGLDWALVKFHWKMANRIYLEYLAIKFHDPLGDLAELILISFYRAPHSRPGSPLEQ